MNRKVIIAEADLAIAEQLQDWLAELDPNFCIQPVCSDGENALAQIMTQAPGIVFLDVELPRINGVEIARTLVKMKEHPLIVFLASSEKFAAEAFLVDALDYVLKPLDKKKIQHVSKRCHWILRAEEMMETKAVGTDETSELRHLAVDKGDTMEVIDCLNIRFIFSKNRYAYISMKNGDCHEMRISLRDIEKQLPHSLFFRCHRNYIVNVEYIKQIKLWFKRGYLLILKGAEEVEIPVGRAFIEILKEHIKM